VGTFFPIEYLSPGLHQQPFAFEVEIYSLAESQKRTRTLFADYYDNRLDRDLERSDAMDKVTPALAAFQALFSHLPAFKDDEVADEFLGQAGSRNDPKILSQLLEWGQETHKRLSTVTAKQPFRADTAKGLTNMMEPSIGTAEFPQYEGNEDIGLKGSVWPFVKMGR
jgi:hypothetical protein